LRYTNVEVLDPCVSWQPISEEVSEALAYVVFAGVEDTCQCIDGTSIELYLRPRW